MAEREVILTWHPRQMEVALIASILRLPPVIWEQGFPRRWGHEDLRLWERYMFQDAPVVDYLLGEWMPDSPAGWRQLVGDPAWSRTLSILKESLIRSITAVGFTGDVHPTVGRTNRCNAPADLFDDLSELVDREADARPSFAQFGLHASKFWQALHANFPDRVARPPAWCIEPVPAAIATAFSLAAWEGIRATLRAAGPMLASLHPAAHQALQGVLLELESEHFQASSFSVKRMSSLLFFLPDSELSLRIFWNNLSKIFPDRFEKTTFERDEDIAPSVLDCLATATQTGIAEIWRSLDRELPVVKFALQSTEPTYAQEHRSEEPAPDLTAEQETRAVLASASLRDAKALDAESGPSEVVWCAIRRWASLVPADRLGELAVFLKPGTEPETMQCAAQAIWNVLCVQQTPPHDMLAPLVDQLREIVDAQLDADWLVSARRYALTSCVLQAFMMLAPTDELPQLASRMREFADRLPLHLIHLDIRQSLDRATAMGVPSVARLESLAQLFA